MMNLLLVAIYVVGFSRVFKGVHSYNQIITGMVLGVLFSFLPSFILYQDLFKFYLTLKHRPLVSILINRYTFIFVVLTGLSINIHWDTQANFKMPHLWTENIKKHCPNLKDSEVDLEATNFKKLI